jgi:ParB/RepB/Spo0J family partition protein
VQSTLVNIPLAAIRVTPLRTAWRTQRRCDERSISHLVRMVGARGWINAIVVRPRGGSCYELIDGERRLESARASGETHIDAQVLVVDDAVALAIALLANMGRRAIKPIEKALLCAQVREALTALNGRRATQSEVGEWVGLGQPTVTQYLQIAEGLNGRVLDAAGATLEHLEPLSAALLHSVARLPMGRRTTWLADLTRGVRGPTDDTEADGVARRARALRTVDALKRECSSTAVAVEAGAAADVLAALAPLVAALVWQAAKGAADSSARAAADGVREAMHYRSPITSWLRRRLQAVVRGLGYAVRIVRMAARKLLVWFVPILLVSGMAAGMGARVVDAPPLLFGEVLAKCQAVAPSETRPSHRGRRLTGGWPRAPPRSRGRLRCRFPSSTTNAPPHPAPLRARAPPSVSESPVTTSAPNGQGSTGCRADPVCLASPLFATALAELLTARPSSRTCHLVTIAYEPRSVSPRAGR